MKIFSGSGITEKSIEIRSDVQAILIEVKKGGSFPSCKIEVLKHSGQGGTTTLIYKRSLRDVLEVNAFDFEQVEIGAESMKGLIYLGNGGNLNLQGQEYITVNITNANVIDLNLNAISTMVSANSRVNYNEVRFEGHEQTMSVIGLKSIHIKDEGEIEEVTCYRNGSSVTMLVDELKTLNKLSGTRIKNDNGNDGIKNYVSLNVDAFDSVKFKMTSVGQEGTIILTRG